MQMIQFHETENIYKKKPVKWNEIFGCAKHNQSSNDKSTFHFSHKSLEFHRRNIESKETGLMIFDEAKNIDELIAMSTKQMSACKDYKKS